VNHRLVAFYLPQFHPIPENDRWWGKGFTEWQNVAKARPLFEGHYQPHLPADLGFYDLRLPETRQAQAELALHYGIQGFCYYHYWFKGQRLLERPFNEVLGSGQPDFPFCLCWANETWRAWDDGCDVLVKQEYSEEDDRSHIRWLLQAFQDKRYIKIDGRPIFLVYRASRLPDPGATTAMWRAEAKREGFPDLYLCRVESFPDEILDPTLFGFDAAVEFQPRGSNLGRPFRRGRLWNAASRLKLIDAASCSNIIFDYETLVTSALARSIPPYKRYPSIVPSWDNSARKKDEALIFRGSTPDLYQAWLEGVTQKFHPYSRDENLIFINAWNEWGEGNHLEPCQKWGRSYLEATREAMNGSTLKSATPED
jgi:lipopolysaccharide biosynthesis protein